MNGKTSPRLWVAFDIGIVAVVGLGLLLVLPSCQPGTPTPIGTPVSPMGAPTSPMASPMSPDPDESPIVPPQSPLAPPDASSPIPTPIPASETPSTGNADDADDSAESPPSPSPAADLALPEVAPDFTLTRAGGDRFTLADQLTQGPVVLVFFQKCG